VLSETKQKVLASHRPWVPWVEQHTEELGLGYQTVDKYIRLYQSIPEDAIERITGPAMYVLAGRNVATRVAVIEAQKGLPVDSKRASALVRRTGEKPSSNAKTRRTTLIGPEVGEALLTWLDKYCRTEDQNNPMAKRSALLAMAARTKAGANHTEAFLRQAGHVKILNGSLEQGIKIALDQIDIPDEDEAQHQRIVSVASRQPAVIPECPQFAHSPSYSIKQDDQITAWLFALMDKIEKESGHARLSLQVQYTLNKNQ
jgi:hypothetical protein